LSPEGDAMLEWQDYMSEWQDYAFTFVGSRVHDLWMWFNALSREEWLIVLAACCAVGFLFLKGGGQRGPC
jgi:hypothetical protein